MLTASELERIFGQAVDILDEIGIEFDLPSAREIFASHGARIDGKRVFLTSAFVADTLNIQPRQNPATKGVRRVVAASPFSNSPTILDEASGQGRRGTVEDAVLMYKLAETSDLYESINPGVVDPEGIDCPDQFLAQVAMLLKYSDKWPSLGLRATKSTAQDGDVHASAIKAIRLIKEIKGHGDGPVMGQGICPMAPLAYDEESLLNLNALAEEAQDINLFPCTLSYMTGPESLLGVVIHDLSLALAGAVYVRLLAPEANISFSNFSTMSDMRTMQPVYACPEYLQVQLIFREVCQYHGLQSLVCGCLSDGVSNDYQAGFESCLTTLSPFLMSDVEEVWCYPGHMAAFAGGSFHKMIFDEELMINCNRVLQGGSLEIDPNLKDKLARSLSSKSFLTIGDIKIYRKEQRLSQIFDKRGFASGDTSPGERNQGHAAKEIAKRYAAYVLPERDQAQRSLLQRYLPTQCKY